MTPRPPKNVIIRRPDARKGQGLMTATSARTGWEYEHDETDAQIEAIEGLLSQVREESGACEENKGCDEDGLPLRGASFSWSSSTDEGEGVIKIGTCYAVDGDGVINHRGRQHERKVWLSESWEIDPHGTVREAS